MKIEKTECSETSAYKIKTLGNYPEENTQHTEHGESLKSRNLYLLNVKEECTCRYNSPFKDKILKKYKGFLLLPLSITKSKRTF
jgi:hypothetical protein